MTKPKKPTPPSFTSRPLFGGTALEGKIGSPAVPATLASPAKSPTPTIAPPPIVGTDNTPRLPAHFRAAPVSASITREDTVAELYENGIIGKTEVARSISKLGLSLPVLAAALHVPTVGELLTEFVEQPDASEGEDTSKRGNFTYDEAILALYSGLNASQVAEEIGRTPKAVMNFRWRCLKQGLRINQGVYELLQEGESPEDVAEAANQPLWTVKFIDMIQRVQVYARMYKKQEPVIVWSNG